MPCNGTLPAEWRPASTHNLLKFQGLDASYGFESGAEEEKGQIAEGALQISDLQIETRWSQLQ
jgi:hypothetical protein